MIDVLNLSLTEVAALIRRRDISSFEVTSALLGRIRDLNSLVNAYVYVDEGGSLAAARAADEALARGKPIGNLHGVPLAHKDLLYRQGESASAAFPLREGWRSQETATVLQRLESAGAVTVGRLNMGEFAYDPAGGNSRCGFARNPWNDSYICGGSSSGSGAAVAARLCFGSLGSDTGGSIRLPAAICGVVGLKPTYGRVSLHGCMPLSFSQDSIGPLARTARDAARLLAAIAGPDPSDPTTVAIAVHDYESACDSDPKGLRIGIPNQYFFEHVTDDYAKAFDEALRGLEDLGCAVRKVHIPDMTPVVAAANILLGAESAALHRPLFSARADDYSDAVRTRLENGIGYSAVEYIDALRFRAPALKDFLASMGEIDVLAVPALGIPPPTIAEVEARGADEVSQSVSLLTYWTRPVNFLGVPAISVPFGFDVTGLPRGLQFIAKPFKEAVLIRAACAVERCHDGEVRPGGVQARQK